ncbi:type VI secretion system secreted protein VgrG [Enterobacter sp. BIGb0383]|uniref:type VI secretion system Vgr family protein n=1 Tax=unclassified Enterobacter TaxID=2608935 RepID=UPI000F4AA85D|nr:MULTISPECIES: type VI secretion system Vgr family protein [unclassified Enterobacter]ROP49450.1 type VI secretion system secreted protein VgrG [Enterobacter sp. BIGb0383]ROS00674.1 type VI secretion system secreted protein VgrG [Enterobacter sp. BIGb0359]
MSNHPPVRYSHSHHLLAVKGCDASLDVLAFEGEESLSRPFSYRIEFTCSNHHLTRELMLMKSASLTLQAPLDQGYGIAVQKPLRVIQGVVTGFERFSTSKDETHYALTLQPRMALLSRSHQNAIYQDMSVAQIVEKILRERHGMRGQDFLFSLTREYPRREQVMQYGEDDLRFITRLLGETGIWFRFTTDTRLHIDVVEFYDSREGYERGRVLPSVPPSGQLDGGVESVREMESRYQVVEKQVSTRDYNYRQAQDEMDQQIDITRGDTTTYGEAYHFAENYLTPGNRYERHPAPESGAFYARLRHERCLNRQTVLSGIVTCATLSPGQVLKVTGGEEVTEAFSRGVAITALVSRARRDSSFEARFEAIPDNPDYGYRPEPPTRPLMAGTLPARVTSTQINDTYGHIDRDGRYRVNMLFDREAWDTGYESLWVRQSRPYAGDTYGLHLPLLAGTEVAIGFEDGNPDRPYIAGVLHDSAHPDHVTIRNYKRNVLRTPANNKIRLDDYRGQEHIKISTEHGGKSQVSLGHLVDRERKMRGEGFELRTDSWGAIRAQKGLLITADGRAQAQGQQRDMQEAKRQLQDAVALAESLHEAASVAKAELADLAEQKALLTQRLDELKQAGLLLSAPAGIALTTPKTVQLNAGDNLAFTAGHQADFSVLKHITLAAGKAISLFAREAGIKLFAAKGKVELQAQSDEMHLSSLKDLTLTSHGGKTIVAAKEELLLTCGGAFIRMKGGQIEYGSPGNQTVKAANWVVTGGDKMDLSHQSWPQSVPKQKLRFLIGGTPQSATKPRAFEPYTLMANGAVVQKGLTDADGTIEIDHQIPTSKYQVELVSGEKYAINMINEEEEKSENVTARRGFRAVDPGVTQDADDLGARIMDVFHGFLNPMEDKDNRDE